MPIIFAVISNQLHFMTFPILITNTFLESVSPPPPPPFLSQIDRGMVIYICFFKGATEEILPKMG